MITALRAFWKQLNRPLHIPAEGEIWVEKIPHWRGREPEKVQITGVSRNGIILAGGRSDNFCGKKHPHLPTIKQPSSAYTVREFLRWYAPTPLLDNI